MSPRRGGRTTVPQDIGDNSAGPLGGPTQPATTISPSERDVSHKGRTVSFSQAPPEVHWVEEEGGDAIPEVVIDVPEEGDLSPPQVDSQEETREPEEGPLPSPDDDGEDEIIELQESVNPQLEPTPHENSTPIPTTPSPQHNGAEESSSSSFIPSTEGVTPDNSVMALNWGPEYLKCPRFSEIFGETQQSTSSWPEGMKFLEGKLYQGERLCVPLSLQERLIFDAHCFYVHIANPKLWQMLSVRYEWGLESEARAFSKKVSQVCPVCQACQRPNNRSAVIESTPIPPLPMVSVAIDVFSLPQVEWEGNVFDAILLCVDRHSGWVVALPCAIKGLTGVKAAKMLYAVWRQFGVPSIVTTDLGSQFISAWWRTMCACMGIRSAYSQAYHHQANGRAERAGRHVIERLRRVHVENGLPWVEMLPMVVDRINDTPGVSGISPYHILFGRDRPLGGLPYKPPREAEDARAFFARQEELAKQAAKIVNELHAKEFARINSSRPNRTPFNVGDMVWYTRPPASADKTASEWTGPHVIALREGASSYQVEVKPGVTIKAHISQLKPHFDCKLAGTYIPLHYHQRTVVEGRSEPDYYIVDTILGHRLTSQGKLEFRTKWQGSDQITWEPAANFVNEYNQDMVKYCKQNNIVLDIIHEL